MGVKLKKIRGKWYLVINYKGRRKTKAISHNKAVAIEVRRKVEAALALGDLGVFGDDKKASPTVTEYSERWLEKFVQVRRKRSTYLSYECQMRIHVLPYFGKMRLDAITRAGVEDFVAYLATQKTPEHGTRLSQNSVRLALDTLRAMLAHAVKAKLIGSNPAKDLGDVIRSDKPEREIEAMTRKESDSLLAAMREMFAFAVYCFFLVALRAGLRLGEIAALRWSDLNFGESEEDKAYIVVQRNYVNEEFGTPKSGKSRRVDMSRQLRAALLQLRDERMLTAMQQGQMSITGDLVFQSDAGGPIVKRNIGPRYMEPALERRGLRHFSFHALRHTFASLLLQAGISPAYVQRQLGHSSIAITVDTYGHWIPSENADWINAADSKPTPAKNANQAQTREYAGAENLREVLAIAELNGTMVSASSLSSP
jgi:integrase